MFQTPVSIVYSLLGDHAWNVYFSYLAWILYGSLWKYVPCVNFLAFVSWKSDTLHSFLQIRDPAFFSWKSGPLHSFIKDPAFFSWNQGPCIFYWQSGSTLYFFFTIWSCLCVFMFMSALTHYICLYCLVFVNKAWLGISCIHFRKVFVWTSHFRHEP